MLADLLLGAPKPVSIRLATRRGTDIANEVSVAEGNRRKYDAVRKRHDRGRWGHRRDAYGWCNCYGHAFANRRTSIWDEAQLDVIRTEDGYRVLQGVDEVQPGDIVVYVSKQIGRVHVGIVMWVRRDLGTVPWVLSKWDAVCGEDLHHVRHAACLEQFDDVEIEYWTDR